MTQCMPGVMLMCVGVFLRAGSIMNSEHL
jgi:hypothetical protein